MQINVTTEAFTIDNHVLLLGITAKSRLVTTVVSMVLILLMREPSAFAQNEPQLQLGLHVGYVPGDAFFPVDVGDSAWDTFSESVLASATELRYEYPPIRRRDMTLPLYLGFERLVLQNVDAQGAQIIQYFAEALDRDNELLERKSHPRVLILNRDFDWERRRFFLRYNENWRRLDREMFSEMPNPTGIGVSSGVDVLPKYYQPHLNDMEAVIEDWENGDYVTTLKFRFPKSITFENIEDRRRAKEPVSVHWDDVILVGFPGSEPDDIFRRVFDSTFFVASDAGVSRYRWTTGPQLGDGTVSAIKEWSHLPPLPDNNE